MGTAQRNCVIVMADIIVVFVIAIVDILSYGVKTDLKTVI